MSYGEDGASSQAVVGYKRPPAATRFRKGRSGNPSGRPKRKQDAAELNASIGDIILLEAYRTIEIRENDRVVKMPLIRAVIRSLASRAGSFGVGDGLPCLRRVQWPRGGVGIWWRIQVFFSAVPVTPSSAATAVSGRAQIRA